MASDLGVLGYKRLVLKSDGEPAVQALKEAVKAERHEEIVLESSPVGESQSNGGAECAVQLVQGQFRAMKDSLEARIGTRIAEDSPVVPWLIMHAARTMNRYSVGADGKTPYRRWKGKEFKRDVAEFGEAVLFLKSGSKGADKHDCRWLPGTWLGVRDETGEVIISTDAGIVPARDLDRCTWSSRNAMGTGTR